MNRVIRRGILGQAFSAATVIALALPVFAQEPAPLFDKWRPKAGVYAEPGKNFQSNCDDSGGFTVDRALKEAHPRDGVYATAGAEFDDRCATFNDTIVAFSGKSITTASNICKIENTRVQLPDTVRIDAVCTLHAASGREAVSVQDPNTIPNRENLMFKKIDDKTVILWIIDNGRFTGDGRKLSCCSDQVQRAYAGPPPPASRARNSQGHQETSISEKPAPAWVRAGNTNFRDDAILSVFCPTRQQ